MVQPFCWRVPRRLALMLTLVIVPAALAHAQAASGVMTKEAQAAITPSAALARLKEGNARFAAGQGIARNLQAKVLATAAGQYPFAAILSCMDSRAPVEILFDQTIGDVFSLRVAGNVVGRDMLGSLEYAMNVAGSKLIVVLGHSHCGAVKGAVDDVEMGNLTQLLKKIEMALVLPVPAAKSKDAAYVARVAEGNVHLSVKEIREESPILKGMLDSGKIGLVGGMYDIDTGKVVFYAD
jgi:carbonic anhydrase